MQFSAVLALCLAASVLGSRLHDRVYTSIESELACVRLIDDNGEIGCTTDYGGTVGIVFRINTTAALTAFNTAPKNDYGYIALVNQELFTAANVKLLQARSDLKGVVVFESQTKPAQFSADDMKPNANFGLAGMATNWNSVGGGFGDSDAEGIHWQNLNMPYFLVKEDDLQDINDCYDQRNHFLESPTSTVSLDPDFPLCAMELDTWMWAAKDAETCIRRGYCLALTNANMFGTTKPFDATEDIVMLAAQIDSLAFFHDQTFGGNADASGLVAAIGVADILGQVPEMRTAAMNVVISLFHGESFGYIGSSRVGFDMKNGDFPPDGDSIGFDKIAHYLELNQLMLGSATTKHFYAGPNGATAIVNALNTASTGSSITFTEETGELPPASLRALLHEDGTMPSAGVLTDHANTAFENNFYNSRYDTNENTGDLAASFCELTSVVAKAVISLAGVTPASAVPDANCTYMTELFDCIAKDQNCALMEQYVNPGTLPTQPLSRYVGVASGGFDVASAFVFGALADRLAISRTAANSCTRQNTFNEFASYGLPGVCLNTTTYTSLAISPSFTSPTALRGDRDPRHSTWTESFWDELTGRVFLAPDPKQEAALLAGGLVTFALSFGLTFAASKYVSQG